MSTFSFERPVCLLIHGLGGSPFEMTELAEHLQKNGYPCRVLTLSGHNTNIRDFSTTSFPDWYASAEKACRDILAEGHKVVPVGFSLGGLIALTLAARFPVSGVVGIAAPLFLCRLYPFECVDWRLFFLRVLRFVRPVLRGGYLSPETKRISPWHGYEGVTFLSQLWSIMTAGKALRKELFRVRCPLLLLHSPHDKMCLASNAWRIANAVSSRVRRIELLPILETHTKHHLITTHVETKQRLQTVIVDFLHDIQKEDGM